MGGMTLLCPAMSSELKVLVVEDSDIVRPITEEYLIELGHTALAVATAEEALRALESSVFDALLTDVRLPGMSGISLVKHCASRFPTLALVVTSGYGELSAELFPGELRRQIFMLPKPYDLTAMQRVLDDVALRLTNGL